jgi:uncharacterized surface protein with fasciclin (FAS1) repeats
MRKTLLSILALVLSMSLVAAACGNDDDEGGAGEATTTTAMMDDGTTTGDDEGANGETSDQTIVEIAVSDPNFSTLVSLVQAAGLAETLSGPGPFTVFAPTNAAFDAVPASVLEQLQADPQGALTEVLQLHVISGEVLAEAAQDAAGTCVDTLGGPVRVEEQGGQLTIGGATITQTDIQASNGVIHVIDAVITAPSTGC